MNVFPFLLAAMACIIIWLVVENLRESRKRVAARGAYFSAVTPLFDSVSTRTEPTGFPRLTGRRDTHSFDLQAVPDSLIFRKLPALWVLVTLPEAMPVKATLDIMTRATGHESFSNYPTLPHSLPCPAFLPEGTGVRSDNAAAAPPEHVLASHAALLADPLLKELVISPKGLRIVILGEEAERGRYLLFRDSEVGRAPLSQERLVPILNALLALRQDLLEHVKEQP